MLDSEIGIRFVASRWLEIIGQEFVFDKEDEFKVYVTIEFMKKLKLRKLAVERFK